MAKNLDRNYIKKLISTKTPNNFKFDLANYLYNPHYEHQYPTFKKVLEERETETIFEEVLYFKHYDGTGEYIRKTYAEPKEKGNWHIIKTLKEEVIETSNRFNLTKLVSFC